MLLSFALGKEDSNNCLNLSLDETLQCLSDEIEELRKENKSLRNDLEAKTSIDIEVYSKAQESWEWKVPDNSEGYNPIAELRTDEISISKVPCTLILSANGHIANYEKSRSSAYVSFFVNEDPIGKYNSFPRRHGNHTLGNYHMNILGRNIVVEENNNIVVKEKLIWHPLALAQVMQVEDIGKYHVDLRILTEPSHKWSVNGGAIQVTAIGCNSQTTE